MPTHYTTSLPPGYDSWRTWTPCQDASDYECGDCGALDAPSTEAEPCDACDGWGYVPSEGARPIPTTEPLGHHSQWTSVDDCDACEGEGRVYCDACQDALHAEPDYDTAGW